MKKEEERRKKEEKMDGDSNPNQLSTPCRRWGIKPKIKREKTFFFFPPED
ncbi:MAG: hypothetical protein F6K24_55340 [Okeania sp. SIO2D1]|nr:hypothetical protein [Okeania sp. SIO2D1]